MAKQGAAMQTYNNELVKCLDELGRRRSALQAEIEAEQEQQARLNAQMDDLRRRLDAVNESLAAKTEKRDGYDRTIAETEKAFMQILESSQVLLSVVKRDTKALEEAAAASDSRDKRK